MMKMTTYLYKVIKLFCANDYWLCSAIRDSIKLKTEKQNNRSLLQLFKRAKRREKNYRKRRTTGLQEILPDFMELLKHSKKNLYFGSLCQYLEAVTGTGKYILSPFFLEDTRIMYSHNQESC